MIRVFNISWNLILISECFLLGMLSEEAQETANKVFKRDGRTQTRTMN